MTKMIYWGLFVEEDFEGELERTIENQHITCGFKVEPPAEVPFGETEQIIITHYGKTTDNEGFAVERPSFYANSATPHITISVSSIGKPVDTGSIDFFFPIHWETIGRWGWFGSDGKIHFEKL